MRFSNLMICSLVVSVCCMGCAEVEKSAGQAFGNANSVVTSASPKIWGGAVEEKSAAKDGAVQDEDRKAPKE